jgi:DNA-binding response OmpR family regulator
VTRTSGTASRRPLRVLIADDDPAITTLVAASFKKWRICCMNAHDGASAIHLARTLHPDVLVLDVMMPDLDGFGVLRLLKQDKRTRQIKIILLTSCDGASDIMRGFQLGADDYLTKPFATLELATRVKMISH